MKISPARLAAFEMLVRIETERAFSSILLAEYEPQLQPRDRALCHNIVLGVLRRQIYLNELIRHYTKGRNLDPQVIVSLRIGLFQLLFLDRVPAHSAVDESVRLVERARKRSAKGLVNAVLRRALREPFAPTFESDLDQLSFETSHPNWLLERWIGAFGFEEARSLAIANNRIPKIAFRFTSRNPLPTSLQAAVPSEHVPGAYIVEKMREEIMQAGAEGEIYFQDEASQLVGSSVRLENGDAFLDVCAAPGGKVSQIAAAHKTDVRLTVAGEIHPQRRRLLAENCQKQGLSSVNVIGFDAESTLPFDEGSFDVVLVDAPCSGTGTIRHNPEIRYFLEPTDIEELSNKQRRILKNASKVVRKGGMLVYSTCSLEPEENELVLREFLSCNGEFQKLRPNVLDRFVQPDLFARTFPHRDEMDGFFIASLKRSE